MRLILKEIDKRIEVKLDRSIVADGVKGIMKFGESNDYPQIIERLILSSIDAKAIADVYAKFLIGMGFENDAINSVVVGKDSRGKQITILSLLRQFAQSASFYSGGYIHVNLNLSGEVVNARLVPFKNCRFAKPDTRGFSGKIAVFENWEKDIKSDVKFNKSNIRFYNVFNLNKEVLTDQFKEFGGVENHNGQIYFQFLDNAYLYPLSPFDPVYLDCDTQSQIAIFKNNQIRNGFTDKTIFRVAGDEDATEEIGQNLKAMMGADGDNCTIIEDTINPETGKLDDKSPIVAESIKSNINPRLFESWESALSNNIRKANKALPAVLIDYDESKLGTTSGEGIVQAVNFYNAMTSDDRALISEMFKEIFSKSTNPVLQNNVNWNIKPLVINEYSNVSAANGGQAD
jgi:hypothetical protein